MTKFAENWVAITQSIKWHKVRGQRWLPTRLTNCRNFCVNLGAGFNGTLKIQTKGKKHFLSQLVCIRASAPCCFLETWQQLEKCCGWFKVRVRSKTLYLQWAILRGTEIPHLAGKLGCRGGWNGDLVKPTISTVTNLHGPAFLFWCCGLWGITKVLFAAERKTWSCLMLLLTCLLVPLGSVGTVPRFLFFCCRDEHCEGERGGRGCLLSRSSSTVTSKWSFIWLCLAWKAHLIMNGGMINPTPHVAFTGSA